MSFKKKNIEAESIPIFNKSIKPEFESPFLCQFKVSV